MEFIDENGGGFGLRFKKRQARKSPDRVGARKRLDLIMERRPTALSAAGVEFIDENGGGPGVRLRKAPKQKR
jgi:hypothetical protein